MNVKGVNEVIGVQQVKERRRVQALINEKRPEGNEATIVNGGQRKSTKVNASQRKSTQVNDGQQKSPKSETTTTEIVDMRIWNTN